MLGHSPLEPAQVPDAGQQEPPVAPAPVIPAFGWNGAEVSHSCWALSKFRTPGTDSRIQSLLFYATAFGGSKAH